MQPISDLDLGGMPPISVRKLCFLDVETTGWRPDLCDIIDFASICDGLPWETKLWISPYDEERADRACGREWRKITGYAREEWATAPKPADMAEEIARQLHGRIIVAHNGAFDVSMCGSYLERHGIPWRMVYSGSMVDLYALVKSMLGPLGLKKFDLSSACQFLGFEGELEHRALGGAKRVQLIYHHLTKLVAAGHGIPR
jgi:DNA polymerase III epsilon subunit-like protein